MLNGAGVHKEFGWKPIAKYDFAVAGMSHTINPLPCDFSRTIKIISKWDDGQVGFTINNDAAANYNMSMHKHGLLAGANSHVQAGWPAQTSAYLTQGSLDHILSEMLIEQYENVLRFIAHSFAYADVDNYYVFEMGGWYTQAPPYTRMDFVNGSIEDMVGQVQFFESVYAF